MGMRKEFANMTERDIQEKLDQRYPDEHFDVVLKCWKQIYCTAGYRRNLGQHTPKQRACIQCIHDCVAFPKLMTECGSRAELEWARGQTCIRVMCICEDGRNKSVVVATALQAVYLKMGFNSLGPCHMSQEESWSDSWLRCKDVEKQITFLAHHFREFDATRAGARANPFQYQ